MHSVLRIVLFCGVAGLSPPIFAEPVPLIFDTDYDTDCDDPGALAVLHALADLGEAEILATVASSRNRWSPAAIDVVNTYYGRPNIPIGAPTSGPSGGSAYTEYLANNFPHDTNIDAVPDAIAVYRQVLAAQPDNSVVVATVGYITNLEDLLKSGPDLYSPLSGAELVARKVSHWVCMGGNFTTGTGTNPNFTTDAAATIYAVDNWPTPITFAPREVGSHPSPLRAGSSLANTPANNPVRVAYERLLGSARDHHCADLTAVLHAVRPLHDYWDIVTTGYMHFTTTSASFEWRTGIDKDQNYLFPKGGWAASGGSGYTNRAAIMSLFQDLLSRPPADPQPPPAVAITSPPTGSHFARDETFTLSASAADSNGSISKVEFYANLAKIGEATAPPYSVQWSDSVGGSHQLTARATDDDGATTVSAPITVFIGESSGAGLTGEYFNNADLTAPILTRIDTTVNFNWGTGSPAPAIDSETFSARWTGAILPAHSSGTQTYTFYTNTNDGVRLWIDNQLLIDDWVNGPLRENSAGVALAAGQLHTIRIEFFENTNTAQVELRWATAGIAREIIPQTQLFPQSNQTPIAQNDAATADQDLPAAVPVLANDSDPDGAPQALAIVSTEGGAAGCTLEISGNTIVYTPPPGFLGNDSFTYTVSDGQASASAQVSITVRVWTTFEPFQRRYFTPEELADPGISGWLADPDRDGASNALEYALMTDPRNPAQVPAIETVLREGRLVLTYRKRKDALDHACIPQVSGDLRQWLSGSEHLDETVIGEGAVEQVVEAADRTPIGDAARRFIRLQIEPLEE